MFQKGQSGNPSGRAKGAKDKVKADTKEAFQSLVEGNLKNVEKWIKEVATENPAKALDIILRMAEFFIPKMKSTDVKLEATETVRQVIKWGGKEIEI